MADRDIVELLNQAHDEREPDGLLVHSVYSVAADEIARLREQVGALSANNRRQAERIRQAHASHLEALHLTCQARAQAAVVEIEALRSVVRRLCVRALDDSPLGPVVDTTEARWFNPTPAEMAAVQRALEVDE